MFKVSDCSKLLILSDVNRVLEGPRMKSEITLATAKTESNPYLLRDDADIWITLSAIRDGPMIFFFALKMSYLTKRRLVYVH